MLCQDFTAGRFSFLSGLSTSKAGPETNTYEQRLGSLRASGEPHGLCEEEVEHEKPFVLDGMNKKRSAQISANDVCSSLHSLRNFPEDRGTVTGLAKSFVGLSAAIYTQIYIGVFAPQVDRFVLLIAILPALVGLAGAVTLTRLGPLSV